jgi:molybdopterin converting factor small subunit
MGTVRLKVFAWLRKERPDLAACDVELPADATLHGLLDAVRLTPPDGAILLVNDRRADPATPLRAGDTIGVFPMLDGG